ncbi:MAG: hypothetical protein JXE06_10595, partial [Coriobacteriia bacterium]|nr:hypothetical protein [Coriobacteriia bacterium]
MNAQKPETRTALFVTYEFPPTAGAGVQRLAKFARYLCAHDWRTVALAARHVPGRAMDQTLAEEIAGVQVVRTPARPVNSWVSRSLARARSIRDSLFRRGQRPGQQGTSVQFATRVAATGRAGRTEQITRLIAIPDCAMLWISPAVRAGVRLGRETGA